MRTTGAHCILAHKSNCACSSTSLILSCASLSLTVFCYTQYVIITCSAHWEHIVAVVGLVHAHTNSHTLLPLESLPADVTADVVVVVVVVVVTTTVCNCVLCGCNSNGNDDGGGGNASEVIVLQLGLL